MKTPSELSDAATGGPNLLLLSMRKFKVVMAIERNRDLDVVVGRDDVGDHVDLDIYEVFVKEFGGLWTVIRLKISNCTW